MFLWCSMPRLAWLTFLLIGLQPFDAVDFSAARASLYAELILQALSAYYMVLTVVYGFQHNFYFRSLDGVKGGQSARLMYAGALLWLVITIVSFVWQIWATLRTSGSDNRDKLKRQVSKRPISRIDEMLIAKFEGPCTWLGELLENYWMERSDGSTIGETSSLFGGETVYTPSYGAIPGRSQGSSDFRKEPAKVYAVTAMTMFLLWIAQWLFWGGFIGLTSEEYVFRHILWSYS